MRVHAARHGQLGRSWIEYGEHYELLEQAPRSAAPARYRPETLPDKSMVCKSDISYLTHDRERMRVQFCLDATGKRQSPMPHSQPKEEMQQVSKELRKIQLSLLNKQDEPTTYADVRCTQFDRYDTKTSTWHTVDIPVTPLSGAELLRKVQMEQDARRRAAQNTPPIPHCCSRVMGHEEAVGSHLC